MKWELLRHRLTDSCLLNLASLSTSRIVSTPQIVGGLMLTGAMRRPETFTKCCSINMQSGRFAESPTWISFVLASGRVLGVSEIWGRGNGACFRFCLGLCERQFVIVKSGIRPRLAGGQRGLRRIAMCSEDFRLRQNPKIVAAVILWRAVCWQCLG